jgi:hypothetical protein
VLSFTRRKDRVSMRNIPPYRPSTRSWSADRVTSGQEI